MIARVTVSSTKTLPAERHPFEIFALRLPVGSLEDLALSRVVPEQLLNQVHVRKQHATAAVAGESQFAQRFSVNNNNILKSVKARQFQFPLIHCRFVFLFFGWDSTYPSAMPSEPSGWISISLMYLVQRSPTTCSRELLVLLVAVGTNGRLGARSLTLPQEKQRTGMIILTQGGECVGVCGCERFLAERGGGWLVAGRSSQFAQAV